MGGCRWQWRASVLRYQKRRGKHSRSVLKRQTHWPSMKRERGLISDCTYNWKEESRRSGGERVRTHTKHTHTAHSWRMRTMSLFSLNRIYKPNRHTPTPLTQTHTISFLLGEKKKQLSASPLSGLLSPTQTHSWDKLCEDFISSRGKEREEE